MCSNLFIEKVLTGQVSGEGVKRTPAYETPLSKHELEKWRKEFWGKFIKINTNVETRTQGSAHIWQLLKNSCEESHETA